MKPARINSLFLVLCFCFMSSAYAADWGSMLNDLTNAGKKLLTNEQQTDNKTLDLNTIIAGLKQALDVSSRRAVENVSQPGGFLNNAKIHIPLPPQVQKAGKLMRQFGMGSLADQFETSMNHAAEKAAPAATNILVDSIKSMSIADAKQILNGSDDAATQYFKKHTSDKLAALFRPSIKSSLNQVGSTQYFNQLSSQLSSIPIVGKEINVDLPDYVTQKALDGLFVIMAEEEKKIRENPAARTTELLKQVFSQQ